MYNFISDMFQLILYMAMSLLWYLQKHEFIYIILRKTYLLNIDGLIFADVC